MKYIVKKTNSKLNETFQEIIIYLNVNIDKVTKE